MTKPLVIVGTGGMARTLYSFLHHYHPIAGFLAHDQYVTEPTLLGKPVVKHSFRNWKLPPHDHRIILGIGYHGMNQVRQELFEELSQDGYEFISYLHKDIPPHEDVGISVNAGVVILEGCAVHTGSRIGSNVFMASNANVGHDCTIQDHAWINSGVCLGGGVSIGPRAVIGMGAVIAQKVHIGEGAFIGAGTLVTSNVPPHGVVARQADGLVPMDSQGFIALTGQP